MTARFAADNTTPRCGKEIMPSQITCWGLQERCGTLVFTTYMFREGDYSRKRVTETCSVADCGVETYEKAEPCWTLTE